MKNKSKYTGTSLNLNVNKDDAELNDFLYCWDQFESRPNKIVIHNTYSTNLFTELLDNYIVERNFFTEVLPAEDEFVINDKMFVKITDDIYCGYIVVDRRHENSITSEVSFFYKEEENFKQIQKIVEELNSCIINFDEEESNNLNTIALSSTSGLEIEPVDMSDFDSDNFDLFYSKRTLKDINKLIKEIKKSPKGLSILYGERGTGKTSVINQLASKLGRIVIFIPNNMIEHTISNPEFRKFLKRYSKPVIVVDDCEMMFNDYFSKSNMFVNNLLQMTDGFLSDSMEVNVVAMFNVDNEDEIDHSLLESNNLLSVIEFSELSEEEANDLAEHLGYKKQYKNKTTVLDITKNRKPKNLKEFGL